jgi:virulence-associated protein VagC
MPEQRRVRLFRNGHNQAVRIPVEFELRAMKRSCFHVRSAGWPSKPA